MIEGLIKWFFLLLLTLLPIPFSSFANETPSKDEPSPIEINLDLVHGFESNVFLADRDSQSDIFTTLDANLSGLFTPNEKSIILAFLNGNHKHFWNLDQADETFINLAVFYRILVSSNLGIGLSNTASYSDLNLLDSEGEALPLEHFRSISDKVRFYGQFIQSKQLRIELGIFYRVFNVEEFEGEPSLDFKDTGADLAAKYRIHSGLLIRLKYQFQSLSYDEKQARNRQTSFDGLIGPDNPELRLRRHEISSRLQYEGKSRFKLGLKAKVRINQDRFEDDLSYFQEEVRAVIETERFRWATVKVGLTYKNRNYTERSSELGSRTPLREVFQIANIKLSRGFWKKSQIFLEYEGTNKDSNDSSRRFDNLKMMAGITAAW